LILVYRRRKLFGGVLFTGDRTAGLDGTKSLKIRKTCEKQQQIQLLGESTRRLPWRVLGSLRMIGIGRQLMKSMGFIRVTAASHPIHVAAPVSNTQHVLAALEKHADSDVVVFGELSLTGYSCGDLFSQDILLQAALESMAEVAQSTKYSGQIVVVGLPLRVGGRLYNAAAILAGGTVVAIVPKQYLPNYQEFYEARWFAAGDGSEPASVELPGCGEIPFGIDLLVERDALCLGVEICEDLWMPVPPSSLQATAGANLLLNLSASNELIGKAAWRETLVRSQAGRCLAAYAYASAGPSESTTDVVFGGHCLIAENGALLAQSERIGLQGCGWIEHTHATADIDLQRLAHDRQITSSWQQAAQRCPTRFRKISVAGEPRSDGSLRRVSATPFVPLVDDELHSRCAEIFGIQCAALAKRIQRLPGNAQLNIGVSGGLDSTLALLVAVKTCAHHGWSPQRITGITMPGFGTTARTLTAARQLMQLLAIESQEIDIRQLCLDTFIGLGHQPFEIDASDMSLDEFVAALQGVTPDQRNDLVFENVQARVRTMLLMNRGFVLGTGDLSEQALGWSTYNGDHMSMYNVNTSIPKTLVKFLVRYVAEHEFESAARECLLGIVDTPISPELLPPDPQGMIGQFTEQTLGAYELHDFYLYHLIRFGMRPRKILVLASRAKFSQAYSPEHLRTTLAVFLRRFFQNQFKRSCVPDGPKVGSVSLSPRGDWRMPSDADVDAWLDDLDP
jgi:NAD+ synthase (glutamine-hydrolysing)